MDFRRLQAFITMIDTGSLTAAAGRLSIAQPALSQQLVSLEQEFGAQLLIRTRKGVTPTPAGETLYRHAQIVLRQLAQARAEVRNTGDELSGVVVLGLPISVSAVLSIPLLQRLQERHPGIMLQVLDNLAGEMLTDQALNGRLDLTLLSNASRAPGLTMRHLLTQRFSLVTSRALNRLLPKGALSVADLDGHPLVLAGRGNRLRMAVEEAFATAGLTPRVVAELDSIESLRAAADAGLGSTIIPWTPQTAHTGLLVRELSAPPIDRDIFLATSNAAPLSAPAAAVHDMIIEVTGEIIASGAWVGARAA